MAEISSWSEICEVAKQSAPKEIRLCSVPYASGININDITFSVLCSINGIPTEQLGFLKEVFQRAYYWDETNDEVQPEKGKQFRRLVIPGPNSSNILYNLNFERKLGSKDVEIKLKQIRSVDENWIGEIVGDINNRSPLLRVRATPGKNIVITNRSQNAHQVDGVACLLALMPEAVSVSFRSGFDTIEEQINSAGERPIIIVSESRDPVDALVAVLGKLSERPALKQRIVSGLAGVFIHERVRKTCSGCAKPSSVESISISRIPMALNLQIPASYLLGRGCEKCRHTGYRGTLGLSSWSPFNDSDREVFMKSSADVNELTNRLFAIGARPTIQLGLQQIVAGNTSFEEVLSVAPALSPSFAAAITSQKDQPKVEKPKTEKPKRVENPRILIVEDNEDQQVVIGALFESAGYQVAIAADGQKALDSLKVNEVDLVVCDLMMPNMNGVQFLSHLRNDEAISSIPVLILTAAKNPELEASLIKSGAADYCEKHVTKKVLLARVERLLNTAR